MKFFWPIVFAGIFIWLLPYMVIILLLLGVSE